MLPMQLSAVLCRPPMAAGRWPLAAGQCCQYHNARLLGQKCAVHHRRLMLASEDVASVRMPHASFQMPLARAERGCRWISHANLVAEFDFAGHWPCSSASHFATPRPAIQLSWNGLARCGVWSTGGWRVDGGCRHAHAQQQTSEPESW
ncbi:hypothetical protein BS50DRAFT_254659 [Corynespora cassiicola Philippines]|uniref:Uncharacterized protein n=1 Tax=Corynespora cassiicola Philippines TaxID=1448308 RepID=A0A2T2P4F8_CORCC|nr:hypothetical protein BS50DRAFT_254659 [Corynespora cassiicola Philippines]